MAEHHSERRERLAKARLYFVTDSRTPPGVLRAALEGGVDMLQLRDPSLEDDDLLRAAETFRALCDEHSALFFLNDDPELALRAGAAGVHVGQADASVEHARERAGGELLVGLSTHSPEQLEAGVAAGADQLSVGPVWETPTKPGRPAAGLGYVSHAAARDLPVPWFAIGGIDAGNVAEVLAAGADAAAVIGAVCRGDVRANCRRLLAAAGA